MKNRIHFITFAIIIGILSLNTAQASIVTDGLVSYWPFDRGYIIDKTVKDVSGDNNGTIRGNPRVVPGQIGEALEFDGVNDFVNLTTLGDFGGQIGTSSFEVWIKTQNKKDWMTLINTHGAACPNWGVELNGVNVRNDFEIMKGVLHYYIAPDYLDLRAHLRALGALRGCSGGTNSAGIFDGEWHHIVCTNDYMIHEDGKSGNGKQIIYIDGVPISTSEHGFAGSNKRGFSPFTAPVHLGARKFPGQADGHFMGMIDEVRFYDRPLTADEVIQNFESTEPYNVAPKGKLPTVWATLKTKL